MKAEMSHEQERELSSMRHGLLQAASVLLPPFALLLHLQIQYILVPFACEGTTLLLHLAALGMLLLVAGAGWLAWRDWARVGRGWLTVGEGPLPRSRFLALTALASSLFFAMVILAQWLPILFLSPCQRT